MRLPRRTFLHLAAGAATLPAMSRFAWAQSYPARPVRIVVGFPAGGTTDIGARLIAQWLSERLGQQFIVENRPGAGTHMATETVARASADGYTLLMATTTNAINATLYDKLNYNFVRDIVPVVGVIRSPFVLEVHPAVPVKTVPELIAYAKANSGKINMASFGTGTSSHLTGELFKMATGVEMLHVPYRGSAPMLIDLLSGQVQVAFDNLPASIGHIRSGTLRPLAVTTTTRSEALPDIPALGELLPGFESSAWNGITAPKSTPVEIIDKLNTEINAALGDPKIKGRFAELSGMVLGGTPADFGKHIAEEIEKWGKVVRTANIKPE
jgi:tripartite-type tricarboxylate transporter receptor subunit TctC